MKKRILIILLALCMATILVPVIALAEEGDGTAESPYLIKAENDLQALSASGESGRSGDDLTHSHPVCGSATCTNPDHASGHADSLSYEEWTATEGEVTRGNYYLDKNITLTGNIEITGDVKLCLNGYAITTVDDKIVDGLFRVRTGDTLTICDCKGSGSLTSQGENNPIIMYEYGVFNLYGGTISAPNTAIGTTRAYGSVNIYGGTVQNTGNKHQGIRAVGGFPGFAVSIYGGTITGKYAVNLGEYAKLTLSGSPVLDGTTADLLLYTAAGTAADSAKVDATNYTGTKELTVEEDGTLRNLVGAYAIKDDEAGHFTLKDDTDTYEYAYNSSGGGYVIQEKTPVSTGHSHDDGVAYDNELTADSSGNLLSNGVNTYDSTWYYYYLDSGSYYLGGSSDVLEVSGPYNRPVYTKPNSTVNLCLNGKTLAPSTSMNIDEGGTLIVTDCGEGGKISKDGQVIAVDQDSTLILNGGQIENTSGGMAIWNRETAVINGGTVTGTIDSYYTIEYEDTDETLLNKEAPVTLTGSPVIDGGETADLLFTFTKYSYEDFNEYATILNAYDYTGDKLRLSIEHGIEDAAGITAIRVSEESADKFELVNEGYQLVKDGSYLVVQEISSHSHDGITFDTEWDSSDDVVSTISENMNIVLTDNVTYNYQMSSEDITINSGAVVNLCLNGHTLNSNIMVNSGAELHIYDCSDPSSGQITSDSNTTLYNRGGKISLNSGAVRNSGDAGTTIINNDSDGALTITGGTVEATGSIGDAVYNMKGTLTITGGTLNSSDRYALYSRDSVNISGSTAIEGGKADIYLHTGGQIDPTGLVSTGISVGMNTPGVFTVNGMSDYLSNFTSIDSNYTVQANENGALELVAKAHSHNSIVFDTEWDSDTTTPEDIQSNMNIVLTEDVDAADNIQIWGGYTVNLCLNGHELKMGDYQISLSQGARLNIYDCQDTPGSITNSSSSSMNAVISNVGGTVSLYGGTVENNASQSAVSNDSNGTLNISGGTVRNSGSSGDAVRNWNGTVNMTSGTIDGGDGSESNGLYNKGEANISGGVITAESLSTFITGSTVYNEDGTLTVSGNATVSNTGTGYALQAARNSSEVITVTNITGGSITASKNAAVYISDIPLGSYEGENSVYLSGAPTIAGGGGNADIYMESIFGQIHTELHAKGQDNTPYSGGPLELDIYGRGSSTSLNGQTAVYGSVDTTTFTLTENARDSHILVADSGNLILHKHIWSTAWSSEGNYHWHECTAEDCPITSNADKGSYGTHTNPGDDGDCTTPVTCVCGHIFTTAESSHSLSYSGVNNVITETCTRSGCNHSETVTITAPENLTYDGGEHNATVEYSTDWQGDRNLNVTYTKDGENVTDTTGAGNYTATINIGTEEAKVTYTVAKGEYTEPETGKGYDIDYSDEEITADSGYELSADGSTVASSPLTVTPGTDVYVRRAEDDNQTASAWVIIEIPERPEAPTESPVVTERTPNSITVTVVEGQEYALSGEGQWQTGGEFTNLNADTQYTIYTRTGATDDAFASEISSGTTVSTVNTAGSNSVAVGETIITEDGTEITNNGTTVTITSPDEDQTIITRPESGSVTVDENGSITVPDGSTVQTGDGPQITIGDNNDGDTTVGTDGSINLPGGSSATVTENDETTTITVPSTGGTVGTDENGNITVPEGGTVQTGDGTEITLPGGGTVDPETGAVTPDEGGSVIIGDENNNNTTTITPPNGGSVTPNEDGTVTVPDGSTIQTGDGPEITIGDNGDNTTVSTDGSINLPENGSVDITDADGEKTTVTTPNTGGTVGTDENGNITVPEGGTVQTGDGTEITLPGGGTVDPETGAVTPDEDGSAIIEDSDGNTTTITPPNGGSVTPNEDGTVTVPDGSTIQTGDGTEITLPDGGTVDPETGAVTPDEGGSVIIEDENNNSTTITPPSGDSVTPNDDGTVTVPDGSTVQTEDGPEITIGDNNNGSTTVGTDGSINLPGGGSATVTDSEGDNLTVTVPDGGGTITTGNDGSVSLPGGSTVVDAGGNTTEIPEEGGVIEPGSDLSYDVTVIFDSQEGSEVAAQTIKVNQKVTEPEDPTRSGYSFQGWYTAGGDKWDFEDPVTNNMTLFAHWSRNSSGTYQPIIPDSDGGRVSISPRNPERGEEVTITPNPDDGYEVDEIIVTDRNGNEVEITDNNDGTYSFIQPTGRVTITVTYAPEKCDGTAADNCPSLAFADLNTSMWYHEAVDYAIENGLMNGTGNSVFSPETPITRAQAVTVLWRLENEPQVDYTMTFADVAEGQWYTEAVRWAASINVVGGYSAEEYGTDDFISRQDMATILWRYAEYKGYDVSATADLNYTDAGNIADYALTAMQWACGSGIFEGNGDGTINPTGDTRRCEYAAIMMRFIENVVK